MAKINLKQYGITGTTEVIYNPSYDELYREETRKGLRGYEKGQVTEMGAVNVMTGVYTGRSPKDKFFVMDETTKDTIWWTSPEYKNDNKPVTKKTWKELKKIAVEELSNKKLFVVDTFCGANENTRLNGGQHQFRLGRGGPVHRRRHGPYGALPPEQKHKRHRPPAAVAVWLGRFGRAAAAVCVCLNLVFRKPPFFKKGGFFAGAGWALEATPAAPFPAGLPPSFQKAAPCRNV